MQIKISTRNYSLPIWLAKYYKNWLYSFLWKYKETHIFPIVIWMWNSTVWEVQLPLKVKLCSLWANNPASRNISLRNNQIWARRWIHKNCLCNIVTDTKHWKSLAWPPIWTWLNAVWYWNKREGSRAQSLKSYTGTEHNIHG